MTRGLSTAEESYLRRAHERTGDAERDLADTLRRELKVAEGDSELTATERNGLVERLVNAARDVGAGEVLLDEAGG